jgi:hypothetical protein
MTTYYTFGGLRSGRRHLTSTPMAHAHAYGVAAQLQNGDLMVIGGYDGGPALITGAVDIHRRRRT